MSPQDPKMLYTCLHMAYLCCACAVVSLQSVPRGRLKKWQVGKILAVQYLAKIYPRDVIWRGIKISLTERSRANCIAIHAFTNFLRSVSFLRHIELQIMKGGNFLFSEGDAAWLPPSLSLRPSPNKSMIITHAVLMQIQQWI